MGGRPCTSFVIFLSFSVRQKSPCFETSVVDVVLHDENGTVETDRESLSANEAIHVFESVLSPRMLSFLAFTGFEVFLFRLFRMRQQR